MKTILSSLFLMCSVFAQVEKPEALPLALPTPKPGFVKPIVKPIVPKITDKSRAEYAEAVVRYQGADKTSNDLPAQIKKAVEDSFQNRQNAMQSVQSALQKIAAECGDKFQLDSKALQETGALTCVAKEVPKK